MNRKFRFVGIILAASVAESALAADGWLRSVKVSNLFSSATGDLSVRTTPAPSAMGFSCSSEYIQIQLSGATSAESYQFGRGRMYDSLLTALETGASFTLYVDEVTESNGSVTCYGERLHVLPPPQPSPTQPTTPPTTPPPPTNPPTPPTNPPSSTIYGAFAIYSDPNSRAYSWQVATRTTAAAARQAALSGCNNPQCEVRARFRSGNCFALASYIGTGSHKQFGWAVSVSGNRSWAENAAIRYCNEVASATCSIARDGDGDRVSICLSGSTMAQANMSNTRP